MCDYSSSTPNLFLLLKYCLLLLVSKERSVIGDAGSIWEPDYWEDSRFLWIFLTHFPNWSKDHSFLEIDFQPSLEGAVAPASSNLPLRSRPASNCRAARKFNWFTSWHLSVQHCQYLHFHLPSFLYTTEGRCLSSTGGTAVFHCWLGELKKPFSFSVNLH